MQRHLSTPDPHLPSSGGYVVLLSGGLDSSVLACALHEAGLTVKALTILYGQRHSKEQFAARKIAEHLGIEHRVVDLSGLNELLGHSALVDEGTNVPEGHYQHESMKATVVPNRNMLLIAIAAAWSVATGLKGVAYAAHAGDHAIYPDCRPEFAQAMDSAIQLCDYSSQHLLRPFVNTTKGDIVRIGHRLKVPLQATWSCYNGRDLHCGKCGTCVERIEAFRLARVTDPTEYERAQ